MLNEEVESLGFWRGIRQETAGVDVDGECEESDSVAVTQATRARLMSDGEFTEMSSLHLE